VGYKAWAIAKGSLLVDAYAIEARTRSSSPLAYPGRMYLMMGVYVVTQIYILMKLV
jgi:hypothetical protein